MQLQTALAGKLSLTDGASFFFALMLDGYMRLNPLLRKQLPAMRAGDLCNGRFFRDAVSTCSCRGGAAALVSGEVSTFEESPAAFRAFLLGFPLVDESDVIAQVLESRTQFWAHVTHEPVTIGPRFAVFQEALFGFFSTFRSFGESLRPLFPVNVLVMFFKVALTSAHASATLRRKEK